MQVSVYEICTGVYYFHKKDHRDGTNEKSQWIISPPQERACFLRAYEAHWCNQNGIGWGLHFENGQVAYLGKSRSRESEPRDIFIAKFVDGNKNDKWHGYPADHVKNSQDIPPVKILKVWADAHYIRPALVRKLASGQKCKLSK